MVSLPSPGGPAADRITIWPIEDGSYGLDATFQGASGYERAEMHSTVLETTGARFSFRQELDDAWTIRFGPLSPAEIGNALESFVK